MTIMQMEAGLDTGPMIAKRSMPLTDQTTAQSLHDDLSAMGGEMIIKVLETLTKEGKLDAERQDDALSTYAKLLKKEDGKIDWSQSARAIDQQIRALNPWPGTWTFFNAEILLCRVSLPCLFCLSYQRSKWADSR